MLVSGKEQALPGVLTDFEQEKNLTDHSQIGADEVMARTSEIRASARKNQILAETSKSLRRGVLAAPRGFPGPFLQGDVVNIWRRVMIRGTKRTETCWDGPGIVAVDQATNSTVWVDMEGGLCKCTPEGVRLATEEEILGWEVKLDDLREQGDSRRRRGVED